LLVQVLKRIGKTDIFHIIQLNFNTLGLSLGHTILFIRPAMKKDIGGGRVGVNESNGERRKRDC